MLFIDRHSRFGTEKLVFSFLISLKYMKLYEIFRIFANMERKCNFLVSTLMDSLPSRGYCMLSVDLLLCCMRIIAYMENK